MGTALNAASRSCALPTPRTEHYPKSNAQCPATCSRGFKRIPARMIAKRNARNELCNTGTMLKAEAKMALRHLCLQCLTFWASGSATYNRFRFLSTQMPCVSPAGGEGGEAFQDSAQDGRNWAKVGQVYLERTRQSGPSLFTKFGSNFRRGGGPGDTQPDQRQHLSAHQHTNETDDRWASLHGTCCAYSRGRQTR